MCNFTFFLLNDAIFSFRFFNMPIRFVALIIFFTVLASLRGLKEVNMLDRWMYVPYEVKHRHAYKRMFSHLFIHADLPHLIFNMLSFYFLGNYLEDQLTYQYGIVEGGVHFLLIYFGGGLFATILPYIRNQDNPSYRSLGASGAVSAVIFAVIIWEPRLPLSVMFLPFSIPAYIFGPMYLAFEYWAYRKGGTGIAHDAHIGGAIFGIVYIIITNIEKGNRFLELLFG
jgi:membrane associated rhomboid family serine protease